MIRPLFFAFLLLAPPAWAGGAYDALLTAYGVTYHWPFVSGPDEVLTPITGTCNGTCSYGIPVATNIAGMGLTTSSYTNQAAKLLEIYTPSTIIMWTKEPPTTDSTNRWWLRQDNIFDTKLYFLTTNACGSNNNLYASSYASYAGPGYCYDTIADGQAHMIAVTCQSPATIGCTMYLNGVSQGSYVIAVNDGAATTGTNFGAPPSDGVGNSASVIGDTSVFLSVALTQPQICALYNAGMGISISPCGGAASSRPFGQIIGLRDRAPRLPAALRGAYRRIEPAAFIPNGGKIN